ncbi:MAG TPA: GH25 family lysozyme [Mesorhizobium sp.]
MRSSAISLGLVAALALSGCTSAGVEALDLRPSQEITNSVAMPAPAVPSRPLDVAQPARDLAQAAADANTAEPGMPALEPIALVAPSKNAIRPPLAEPEARAAMAAARPMKPQALEVYRRRFRDAKPINFGRYSPKAHAVHGVDVSRWQGRIDWTKLRSQGANFAYIKATDGGDHLDPMFRKNWKAAQAAGLKRGAYHFFYWCRSASSQAEWFIRNVPRDAFALPPVIDVEWNGESSCKRRPSRENVLEKMQVFMDRLEAHYGQRPVIYTAPDFYRDNLKGAFPNHPFWLRAVAQHPSKVYPGRKWVFWQYSGSGLSHGVSGRVDLNAFHGSEQQWREWVARN